MRRIPDTLLEGHPAVRGDGVSVIGYTPDSPPPPGRFLVRQPTLSFIRGGIKHLQPHGITEPLVAPAGTVVAMGSGVHLMTELLGTDDRYESIVVSVSPGVLRGLLGGVLKPVAKIPVAMAAMPPRVFELLREPMAPEEAERAAREALLVAAGSPEVRALLVAEACLWGGDDTERLRTVMQEHFHTPLAFPEYAALSGMSLSTFKLRFREVFEEAPGRWLRNARLQHARWLLLVQGLTVTDACYASGFGDLSNFIRMFRRQFGLSPRSYRAAQLEIQPSGGAS